MSNNQLQVPDIKKFPSNKTILISSIFSILIPSIISIFTFNQIDIYLKIIICLFIACFVLFVDAIFYFVKEREYCYAVCYLENSIALLQNHISMIESSVENSKK